MKLPLTALAKYVLPSKFALPFISNCPNEPVPKILIEPVTSAPVTTNCSIVTVPALSFLRNTQSCSNKIKYGVQIEKLTDVLQKYSNHSVYCRMIKAERDENFYEKLKEIHKEVHGKPYDLHMKDWIKALLNLENPIPVNSLYQHTNEFWCSALLSFIYFKLGWISECNWSLIAPREFSSVESTGQLLFTCIIKDEEEISLK